MTDIEYELEIVDACLEKVPEDSDAKYRDDDGPWLPLASKRPQWLKRKATIERQLRERGIR